MVDEAKMATSGQLKQPDCKHSGETWKLNDKVKFLRISCGSSGGDGKIQMRAPTKKVTKQGPKVAN